MQIKPMQRLCVAAVVAFLLLMPVTTAAPTVLSANLVLSSESQQAKTELTSVKPCADGAGVCAQFTLSQNDAANVKDLAFAAYSREGAKSVGKIVFYKQGVAYPTDYAVPKEQITGDLKSGTYAARLALTQKTGFTVGFFGGYAQTGEYGKNREDGIKRKLFNYVSYRPVPGEGTEGGTPTASVKPEMPNGGNFKEGTIKLEFSTLAPSKDYAYPAAGTVLHKTTPASPGSDDCFTVEAKDSAHPEKGIIVSYHAESCNLCGNLKLKVQGTANSEGVSIPVSISCKADMLLVANEQYVDQARIALGKYTRAIAKEGLSSIFVNLGQFSLASNGKAAPLDQPDTSRPVTFKNVLAYLSTKLVTPKYVMLLGDTDRIPMQDLGDQQKNNNKGQPECIFGGKPPCALPSDRPYAVVEGLRYKTVVARIPGNILLVGAKLESYADLHTAGLPIKVPKRSVYIYSDACGGTKKAGVGPFARLEENCFIRDESLAMQGNLGRTGCNAANGCFMAPSYCLYCSGGVACDRNAVGAIFRDAGLLQINQHGSGTSFSSVGLKNGKEISCDAARSSYFSENGIRLKAGVITSACYGAAIDSAQGAIRLGGFEGTAKAMLQAGAPFYIGTTRINYGIGTPKAGAIQAEYEHNVQISKAIMTCPSRLGDCFYDQMSAYLRLFSNPDVQAAQSQITYSNGQGRGWFEPRLVQEYQFYGDPTLKIKVE